MSILAVQANFFSKFPSTFHVMLAFLYLLLPLSNIGYVTGEQCLARAPAGIFRGTFNKSRSLLSPRDSPYCSFRGIRYGQAPIGDLRFARPRLAEPLGENIYNATEDGNECPQIMIQNDPLSVSVVGAEDCLFLNVYTPQVEYSCSLLPVMVFIPGGAYIAGSNNSTFYGPDNFVTKDVVLVTVNYRLGPFGFLNLKDPRCSGNMGLADTILALKWVQLNIKAFCGDPNRVTLFGESLFQKCIIESCVFSTQPFLMRNPDQVYNASIQLALFAGYQGSQDDANAALSYLKSKPADALTTSYAFQLLKSLSQNDTKGFILSYGPPLAPCQDYYVDNAILPGSFQEMGESAPGIQIIIGQLNRDGTVFLFIGPPDVNFIKTYLEIYLREANRIFVKDQQTEDRIKALVIAHFFNPSNNDNELDEAAKLLTFLQYYNFYKLISYLRASYLRGIIYLYQFNVADGGPLDVAIKIITLGKTYYNKIKGVSHGGEIPYLFYVTDLSGVTPSDIERKTIYDMCTWWTNFAKTGNPNNKFDGINVVWEPTTPCQYKYLNINNTVSLRNTKINQEEYDFFDKLEKSIKYDQGRQNAGMRPNYATNYGEVSSNSRCEQFGDSYSNNFNVNF